MSLFKPEDFDYPFPLNEHYSVLMAKLANAKLLSEGKVVYGKSDSEFWGVTKPYSPNATHKALLINIEPIEKCKHERVLTIYGGLNKPKYQCECGAEVRPTAFEVVK